MPPITRYQSKKSNLKTEPYSKENRPSDKRAALSDLSKNNVPKTVVNTTNKFINKSNEIVIKEDETISTNDKASTISQPKCEIPKPIVINESETKPVSKDLTRLSLNDTKQSIETLYQSAIDESVHSRLSTTPKELYTTALNNTRSSFPVEINQPDLNNIVVQETVTSNEEDIFEIDENNWNDHIYVGCYAREIFKYLSQRENQFMVTDYIGNQSELTPRHRATIVNWLVNLQELFELNHEVLYMAVKLIDLYLAKNDTQKNKFQLLASGALLIASKIDEREPGLPLELVKQSKYIYTPEELFVTERELVKALNYDINFPLSYTFLRRYARCMKCQMGLLTLARYILESSLLEYNFITYRDSLKAAAALYLALQMIHKSINTNEFKKYTGYKVNEIKDTVIALNNMLHSLNPNFPAVKQKYLHETFYKVASKPLLCNSKLTFD